MVYSLRISDKYILSASDYSMRAAWLLNVLSIIMYQI
jgi:hypothetical protein